MSNHDVPSSAETSRAPSRRHLLGLAGSGAALAGAALLGRAPTASADPVQTEGYPDMTLTTMGSLGLTSRDVARISVVMYGDEAGVIACNGLIELRDLHGKTVASHAFTLTAGQGTYLDWSPPRQLILQRTQVSPVIAMTSMTGDYDAVTFGATFEVFDAVTLVNRASLTGIFCTAR